MMAQRMLLGVGVVALTTALVVPGVARAQEISGIWESRSWGGDGDADRAPRVHLNLKLDRQRDHGSWQMGFGIEVAELSGVSLSQLRGSASDVSSRLVREAGAVSFEGDIRDGRGTGFFSFIADAAYVRRMAELGYAGLSDERLFLFVTQDVTTEYVVALRALGYADLPEEDLVKFAIHGVSADFIRGMNSLGYTGIPVEQLVTLRIHGVGPDYVRRVREALGVR